jgi:hypothetical protein
VPNHSLRHAEKMAGSYRWAQRVSGVDSIDDLEAWHSFQPAMQFHSSCTVQPPKLFRNWCRPNPDFLQRLVEPRNYMRLSVKKVAHNCSRPVLRRRKSGDRQAFSWFSPKENHTSRSFSVHSNCETALVKDPLEVERQHRRKFHRQRILLFGGCRSSASQKGFYSVEYNVCDQVRSIVGQGGLPGSKGLQRPFLFQLFLSYQ